MKRNVTLLYLFLIFFSLLPYFLERSERIVFFQNIFGWLIFPYKTIFNNIYDYLKIKEENDILKKRLIVNTIELNKIKIYKIENQELKKILQFTIDKKTFIEPLQVITVNEEGGNIVYICKKKTFNIIYKDLPVIGYEGLIGKTKEVSNDFIIVQSIKHSNNFVSVMNTRTGAKGILRWNGEFIIDGISSNEDIRIGDTIVTSGMGRIYPKGINVGIVKELKRSIKEYETKIYLKTFEMIKFYDEIFVIFNR